MAYALWGILLKYNPVSKVAIYGFTNPVIGVLLSALLLGEGGQALFSEKSFGAPVRLYRNHRSKPVETTGRSKGIKEV